jgi:hypothetical protein
LIKWNIVVSSGATIIDAAKRGIPTPPTSHAAGGVTRTPASYTAGGKTGEERHRLGGGAGDSLTRPDDAAYITSQPANLIQTRLLLRQGSGYSKLMGLRGLVRNIQTSRATLVRIRHPAVGKRMSATGYAATGSHD